jgi:hypothetical protein
MKRIGMSLVLLLLSSSAFAQLQFKGSAKFVCGKADAAHIKAFAFSPGSYFTTINVTNPNAGTVSGTKRFSVALLSQKPGKTSVLVNWALKPSQSMQIDCGDIYKNLGILPGTFIDGFVHIVGAPVRFDVTAVHTLSDGVAPVSIDVEAITLR